MGLCPITGWGTPLPPMRKILVFMNLHGFPRKFVSP